MSIQQLLWILFSDANSRFNTLIEECAHLQDTIVGLTANPALVARILSHATSTEDVRGFSRAIVCDPKVHDDYYTASVRDRAFISLWNSLGAVIKGLDRNQKQHELSYQKVVREHAVTGNSSVTSQALYWYISQRGYFLNSAFAHYTAQLEHAHEKLIQMLENQAGTLPNPILLRRWNSAAYGEFLSEYSRHVNWEAWACTKNIFGSDAESVPLQSITHTWAHNPTSVTKYFDVHLTDPESKGERMTSRRFAIIRSAYFYLEQPVLLPLLYHECVHINFPDNERTSQNPNKFFGARLEATKSLRVAKFPVELPRTYENFWDHFTEEVWADAMSVALGGRAYLIALTLQLAGLSGTGDFNHYRVDEDTMYALDDLGRADHRKYEVNYPTLDLPFFWEARLRIASEVLKGLCHGKYADPRALPMVSAVDELVAAWHDSGKAAYGEEGTSVEHASWWKYRISLNEWVVETVLKCLRPTFGELGKASNVCSTYHLTSANARVGIAKAVNAYRSKYFKRNAGAEHFTLDKNHRLENVAVDVRWALSRDIVLQMRPFTDRLECWTDSFSNWMRHDGGAAFRIALEACRVRLSLMDGLADLLTERRSFNHTPSGIEARLEELPVDFLRGQAEQTQQLLRRRGITNARLHGHERDVRLLLGGIDSIANDVCSAFLISDEEEVKVGTLSLGVVRPEEFAVAQGKVAHRSPYLSALDRVEKYLTESARTITYSACRPHDALPSHLATEPKFESVFVKLIGEYQFLAFTRGSTPVERDAHPGPFAPRMLVKPRLVLQVAGSELRYEGKERTLWARVSLIRFRHRWQWADLTTELDREKKTGANAKLADYSLFLSSAWEDVVLVTWHNQPGQLWEADNFRLSIGSRDGVDTQSTFVVPETSYHVKPGEMGQGTIKDWLHAMKTWANSTNLVSRVYRRSGRYDYTVVWSSTAKDAGGLHLTSLEACTTAMASMPVELWQQVQSMITSYEKRVYVDEEQNDAATATQRELKAVTHFAIRDV